MSTFWQDTVEYAQEVKHFDRKDWLAYLAWVGLILGLFFLITGFLAFGFMKGVNYPAYVWNMPIGIAIFVAAVSFDTIGHLGRYKECLKQGEALVHHITTFAGISSCVALLFAYKYPIFLKIPALALVTLSIFYSVIDECLHWHRYLKGQSDRVEMWSHFFVFFGHGVMIAAWTCWFLEGYPGVAETVRFLPGF